MIREMVCSKRTKGPFSREDLKSSGVFIVRKKKWRYLISDCLSWDQSPKYALGGSIELMLSSKDLESFILLSNKNAPQIYIVFRHEPMQQTSCCICFGKCVFPPHNTQGKIYHQIKIFLPHKGRLFLMTDFQSPDPATLFDLFT